MDDEAGFKSIPGEGTSAVLFGVLLFVGAATGVGSAGVEASGASVGDESLPVGLVTGAGVLLNTGAAVGGEVGGTVVGAGVATGGVVLKNPVLAWHCGESKLAQTGVKAT